MTTVHQICPTEVFTNLLPFAPDLNFNKNFLIAETSQSLTACNNSLSFPIFVQISNTFDQNERACGFHESSIFLFTLFDLPRHAHFENKRSRDQYFILLFTDEQFC